jgi:hypothetical protein
VKKAAVAESDDEEDDDDEEGEEDEEDEEVAAAASAAATSFGGGGVLARIVNLEQILAITGSGNWIKRVEDLETSFTGKTSTGSLPTRVSALEASLQ